MLKLTNLRRPVEEPEAELVHSIAERLQVAPEGLSRWKILRKSLDGRQSHALQFVYTVAVELPDEATRWKRLSSQDDIAIYEPKSWDDPPPGSLPMSHRPVVIGSGPAGLLAGYYLAYKGYRPLIIERGTPVKERVPAIRRFDRGGEFEQENNYLFGEGGAGCFSDGKLTCRMSGPDVDWVLERFVECGGKPEIVYVNRPHLGSNRLPMICRNFRRKIEKLGGEYRFNCRFEGLELVNRTVKAIHTSSGTISTSHVFLGIGHSARDTYEMLHEAGVPMQAKAFQLGLRIEQPQTQINQHQYAKERYLNLLGAANYTVVAKGAQNRNVKDLFTFCMCAGGIVIPSVSEPGMICSNGMSNSRHNTPFANSGLVVTLEPEEFGSSHPLAGVEVQRKYETQAFTLAGSDYQLPIQTAHDFLANRTPDRSQKLDSSYERGTQPLPLAEVLPPSVLKAMQAGLPIMDRKWNGDFLKNATLVGPEMRGSSPVRIDRNYETRVCPGLAGLYPIGEGAGYAGGIISAAVDGMRSARAMVREFAPVG